MTDTPFVPIRLATIATGVSPPVIRQWLHRQWHQPKRRTTWTIAVACDIRTHHLVYSLPDVMRAEAATRRSRNNRRIDDKGQRIA